MRVSGDRVDLPYFVSRIVMVQEELNVQAQGSSGTPIPAPTSCEMDPGHVN